MKAILATLALVPGLALAVPPARAPRSACVAVEVSADAAASPATRFSVSKTLDLTFTVLFSGPVSGDHVAELRVLTPDGHLYQSLAVPYTGASRAAASRALPGYARAVAERKVTGVSRGGTAYPAVKAALPVGGTDIVSSGLYGKWKVEVRIDGAEETCTAPATFTLVP